MSHSELNVFYNSPFGLYWSNTYFDAHHYFDCYTFQPIMKERETQFRNCYYDGRAEYCDRSLLHQIGSQTAA